MRTVFPIIFILLIVALLVCSIAAKKSRRPIGPFVARLDNALIPPVAGNLIIILSQDPILSYVGCYLYFIGMNYVVFTLLRFTLEYCRIPENRRKFVWIAYIALILDTVSLLLNMVFQHAFVLEKIDVLNEVYYRFIPLTGQTIHRIVDYGIFFAVLVIFLVKMVRSPRVYLERYSVIFVTMVAVALWQTYYIFSRTPIDRSMVGFGVFGLLVFFFSIYYRPLRLLDRMLVGMASELPDAVLFFDENRQCIWINSKAAEILGISEKELEQVTGILDGLFGKPPEDIREEWSAQKELTKDGETHYYYLQRKTVYDNRGRLAGAFLSFRDNTEERKALEIERYNANHDLTTGLYNRKRLYERIRETLDNDPRPRYIVVAVIEGFAAITDVYGNAFGELALLQAAEHLSVQIPKDSVYGRLGGTEFGACVLVDEFNQLHMQDYLSHLVVRAENVEQHIFIHFGVYRVEERNLEISVMFDRARLGLTKVSENLKQYVGFYEEGLRDKILWNHQISAELPQALQQRQIVPYLQPIMDSEGKLVGAEVLARWIHPVEGFLSPAAFIPVFEKNGLIAEVDRYMWRCACEIVSGWEAEGLDLFLSINISPRDFDVIDVLAEIKQLVVDYGINPAHLRLEITETALGIEQQARMNILKALRNEGFIIEMDDFGSGYSSMNLLKDMPVDLVKLDMVFLQQSTDQERAKMIVEMLLLMMHRLGIISLMEGVETDSQYQVLSRMGCQYFQGYYFSKPIPLEDFQKAIPSDREEGGTSL